MDFDSQQLSSARRQDYSIYDIRASTQSYRDLQQSNFLTNINITQSIDRILLGVKGIQ